MQNLARPSCLSFLGHVGVIVEVGVVVVVVAVAAVVVVAAIAVSGTDDFW